MEIIVCFILLFRIVGAQTYSEMDNLLENLFNASRYNRLLRPLQNQSHVMQVNITQYVTVIEYFDITSGELLVSGFFEIKWRDELLTWDPALFGGKKAIPLLKQMVWKPEISLISASDADNDGSLIGYGGFASAWVDHQGHVVVVPTGTYRTRCNVNTSLFPYDKHICPFQFYVSNHDISELMLYSPTENVDTTYFIHNGEWVLENTKSVIVAVEEKNIENFSVAMMETSLTLTRRPAFELLNTYSPVTFMSILNLLTCFIRPDSGERLTFAVTLYLALSFTSTACIERFPNNSLNIPYFSYGFLLANIINTAGVSWSIYIVRLASSPRKSSLPFPKLVRYLVMNSRKRNTGGSSKISTVNTSETIIESLGEEEYEESRDVEKEDNYTSKESDNVMSGIEIANALDKIYFVFILILLCVFNICFSTIIMLSHNNS